MPAKYIDVALHWALSVGVLLALAGCSIGQQGNAPSNASSPKVSPSPSAPLALNLWVLSPVGLKLRDQPATTGKELATVPQGTKLTATAKHAGVPAWYQVAYGGNAGWVAASLPGSSPPIDLVSIHPQLSFSSSANSYYFLYPADWTVSDRGNDVEADGPVPAGGATPAPLASNSAPQVGVTASRLLLHQAATTAELGNIPTTPGANLDATSVEVGGFTVIDHSYQLNGGGFEADVKVSWITGKALLITFRTAVQSDLATFHEILESFGFSVPPSPGASP